MKKSYCKNKLIVQKKKKVKKEVTLWQFTKYTNLITVTGAESTQNGIKQVIDTYTAAQNARWQPIEHTKSTLLYKPGKTKKI